MRLKIRKPRDVNEIAFNEVGYKYDMLLLCGQGLVKLATTFA